MKTLKIIALVIVLLAGGLYALRAYNSANAPLAIQIAERSEPNIKSYLAAQMHDPGSLEIALRGVALRLDTIQDPNLFRYNRQYHAVHVKYRGNNAFGAPVLNEGVFFVTQQGGCMSSTPYEKLTSQEMEWLNTATLAVVLPQN